MEAVGGALLRGVDGAAAGSEERRQHRGSLGRQGGAYIPFVRRPGGDSSNQGYQAKRPEIVRLATRSPCRRYQESVMAYQMQPQGASVAVPTHSLLAQVLSITALGLCVTALAAWICQGVPALLGLRRP